MARTACCEVLVGQGRLRLSEMSVRARGRIVMTRRLITGLPGLEIIS